MSSLRSRSIAVGCELGATESEGRQSSIRRFTVPFLRSNSATAEPFHKLTHALVPARLAMTVYGYAAGMYLLVLISKDFKIRPELTSSRTTLSERLFATSRRSPSLELKTASPAGYAGAVSAGFLPVLRVMIFPLDICCAGIVMKRSGATSPSENL